jgi:hypothetical protein
VVAVPGTLVVVPGTPPQLRRRLERAARRLAFAQAALDEAARRERAAADTYADLLQQLRATE